MVLVLHHLATPPQIHHDTTMAAVIKTLIHLGIQVCFWHHNFNYFNMLVSRFGTIKYHLNVEKLNEASNYCLSTMVAMIGCGYDTMHIPLQLNFRFT